MAIPVNPVKTRWLVQNRFACKIRFVRACGQVDSLLHGGPEHTVVRLFDPLQYRPLDDGTGLLQYLCSVLWPVPHVTVQPE